MREEVGYRHGLELGKRWVVLGKDRGCMTLVLFIYVPGYLSMDWNCGKEGLDASVGATWGMV
eukprot:8978031-Ditylum_brightwellii.AAC.1